LTLSGLDWTLVHPAILTDGEPEAEYRAGESLRFSLVPTVARADVARFILDELEHARFVRKRVEIARRGSVRGNPATPSGLLT